MGYNNKARFSEGWGTAFRDTLQEILEIPVEQEISLMEREELLRIINLLEELL